MSNKVLATALVVVCAVLCTTARSQEGQVLMDRTAEHSLAKKSDLMLRRSDVVMSYPYGDAEIYEKYGATVWGWGPDPAWSKEHAWRVNNAYKSGLRTVSTQVNPSIMPPPNTDIARKLATDPELKAAVCIDVEGKPIITPFWPVDYGNGEHAWWYCTNNPAFVQNVHERIQLGFAAGTNAYHMDMPYGSAHILDAKGAGCFCKHCLAGFREYLKKNYSVDKLKAMGIDNVDSFDYRAMVSKQVNTVKEFTQIYFNQKDGQIPLIDDFEKFQFMAATKFIKQIGEFVEEVGGPEAPFSANSGGLRPNYLMGVEPFDYFVVEISHYRRPGNVAVLPYKLADALGKPIALWPVGPDVKEIEKRAAKGLLKRWIALSYAQGGNLMVPHMLWTGTSTSGVKHYQASADDYAPLYQFVRRNAELFDGYEAVEQVGLLYSNRALREPNWEVVQACWELMNANVPFGLALAGDDFLARTLDKDQLSKFELVIVPEPHKLDGEQFELVNSLKAEGEAVTWVGVEDVLDRISPLVSHASNSAVWLFPRKNFQKADAPVVVHLVNHSYDASTDTLNPQTNLTIRLRHELFDRKKVSKIELVTSDNEPKPLSFENKADGVHVTIPELDLWGILEIVLE